MSDLILASIRRSGPSRTQSSKLVAGTIIPAQAGVKIPHCRFLKFYLKRKLGDLWMVTMEELLASQTKKFKTLSRGQEIEGTVVSISDREITLDLGSKSEGVLQVRELSKDKLGSLKVEDKLKVFVSIPENESGQAVVSLTYQIKQSRDQMRGRGPNWQRFAQAQTQKSKLSGKVLEINKGGLIVDVEGSRGFLPNSQVGFELLSKASKGMEDLVGQTLTITVIEIDQNNNKLIFSQRGQVSDEVKKKLSGFKKDQKATGKIVAVLPFGLVVDVEGSQGLVFISDVSWERQEDLSKQYSVGSEVEVLITGLDEDLGRLNLSIKQLSEDPFLKLVDKYPTDEVVKGEVISVTDSGVVFKLDEGIEGLLPVSKMEQTMTYDIGKSMSLLVDSVDTQRRKINLTPFITSTEGLIYK